MKKMLAVLAGLMLGIAPIAVAPSPAIGDAPGPVVTPPGPRPGIPAECVGYVEGRDQLNALYLADIHAANARIFELVNVTRADAKRIAALRARVKAQRARSVEQRRIVQRQRREARHLRAEIRELRAQLAATRQ